MKVLRKIFSHIYLGLIWLLDRDNRQKIYAQYEMLEVAADVLGKKTAFQKFDDVADPIISIAKTVDSVLDGQTDEEKNQFVEAINKADGKLSGLRVELDNKEGVIVKWGSARGSYNPSTGTAKIGLGD